MHSGRDAADNGEGRERGVTSILITDGHELAGLGAARSLGRAGHRVTVAVPQGLSAPVARSRYVAQVIDSPSPWADQAAFRRFLLAEARKYEVLLPVSEAAIAATATLRAELAPVRLLMPSDDSLRYTLSKYHATKLAQSVGLATPPTVLLSDGSWPAGHSSDVLAPLVELLRPLGYPLLLKHDNYLSLSGKYVRGSTQKVYSPLQARALLAELREQRAQVIAQTEMPGHGAGVFLLRHQGQTVLRFAHERLHEVPYTGGVSSLRRSCHDDPLVARSEKLLAKIDYQGVAMVEFRKDQQGEPLFLEVNGRLWGSLALALHAGVDFPLQLLESCHTCRRCCVIDRCRCIAKSARRLGKCCSRLIPRFATITCGPMIPVRRFCRPTCGRRSWGSGCSVGCVGVSRCMQTGRCWCVNSRPLRLDFWRCRDRCGGCWSCVWATSVAVRLPSTTCGGRPRSEGWPIWWWRALAFCITMADGRRPALSRWCVRMALT